MVRLSRLTAGLSWPAFEPTLNLRHLQVFLNFLNDWRNLCVLTVNFTLGLLTSVNCYLGVFFYSSIHRYQLCGLFFSVCYSYSYLLHFYQSTDNEFSISKHVAIQKSLIHLSSITEEKKIWFYFLQIESLALDSWIEGRELSSERNT